MSIEEAAAILNRENHRERCDWSTEGTGGAVSRVGFGPPLFLTKFEALAIAVAYQHQPANPEPPTCLGYPVVVREFMPEDTAMTGPLVVDPLV